MTRYLADDPDGHAPRRFDALLQLLHPQHLRESFALAPQRRLQVSLLVGLQTAIATALALTFFHLSPFEPLIGFGALGAMVALFGRFAPQGGRGRVVMMAGVVQTLGVLAMSLVPMLGLGLAGQFAALALVCGVLFLVSVSYPFGPPGALIFVFAAGAGLSPVEGLADVLSRGLATGSVAVLAWAIVALTEGLRPAPLSGPEPIRPWQPRIMAALRITVGSGAAVFASHALGLNHPVWAAMGSLAVMQGAHLHISLNRGVQRMAGTIVGAVVAWTFLSADPNIWMIIAALMVFQIIAELVIGANYGLGQILVTPMALLMTYLAMPGADGPAMALERVVDTMLGAVIGLIAAVLLSTLDDRRYLARHTARRPQG